MSESSARQRRGEDRRSPCGPRAAISGLTIGHTDDQLTLPLGVTAELDADRGELVIEEAGVE